MATSWLLNVLCCIVPPHWQLSHICEYTIASGEQQPRTSFYECLRVREIPTTFAVVVELIINIIIITVALIEKKNMKSLVLFMNW